MMCCLCIGEALGFRVGRSALLPEQVFTLLVHACFYPFMWLVCFVT